MMTNTNTDRADFRNAQHLRDFVELVAENLRRTAYPNGERIDAVLVDFGEDNLLRPPAITFAPELPALMQPRIYFRYNANARRLEINAGWPVADGDGCWGRPTDADLKGVTTLITVAADKSAAQVARDIAKRLLPTWLSLHKELQRRIAVHQQSVSASRAIAERLARGQVVRRQGDSYRFTALLGPDHDLGTAWGEVTVTHGRVKIELASLSEEQAAAVLAALRGAK